MFLFSHLTWVGLLNDSEQYQRRRARVCGVQLLRTRSERVIWNELWIACRVHRDFLENKLCSRWNLTCKALLLPLPPHTFLVVSDLRVLPRFSQGLPSQVPTPDTHQSGQGADVSWQAVPSPKEFIISIKLKIKIKKKIKKDGAKYAGPHASMWQWWRLEKSLTHLISDLVLTSLHCPSALKSGNSRHHINEF